MRLYLVVAALVLAASSSASAQTDPNSNSSSSSGASAIVNGDTVYNPSRIKQRVDSTASGIAPGLTAAGVHSCAGSASVGVGATGLNFGFGATYEMVECNRRAYAATLSGMGQNAAALALVCNNAEVQAALNQTGVICPQQRASMAASDAHPTGVRPVGQSDGSGASSGTRYIPINGRGQQLIPISGSTPSAYASTGSVAVSAASIPPFCENRDTYSPSLCAGVSRPR